MLNKAISLVFDPTMFYYAPDEYVAPFSQTKYLVLSSLFFFMVSIYGFINNQLLYAIICLVTSITSMHFWRDATYSYRRCMDLIIARMSFITFLLSGCYYTSQNNHNSLLCIWYIVVLLSIYYYYMSHKIHNINRSQNNKWYKYHAMFHFICSCGMLITIISVINYKNINV